ncbi:hypothetical protein EDD11_002617 [Mortierella claussenii]|nr:hypothetical protein EDD11_002617 [Mortierella claussenii]
MVRVRGRQCQYDLNHRPGSGSRSAPFSFALCLLLRQQLQHKKAQPVPVLVSAAATIHPSHKSCPTYPRRAKYDLSQDPYSTEDSQEIDLRVWEPQQPRLIHQDGFIMADDVEDENDDDLDVGHGPLMETLAAMIDLERAQEDPQTIEAVTEPAAPEARGQKPLSQMVWLIDTNDSAENLEGALHKYDLRHPDAKILPDAVILDKQKYLAAVMSFEDVDDQDVEDFLNSDSLEALTIDARDASAFRDFLATLEAEGTSEDQLEDQRHQQHQQWVKATNDLVIDPILEHDLPVVGWTPTVIRGFPQMFQKILNSATESSKRLFSQAARSVPYSQNLGHDVRRARGQIFEYVAGWTECMILVVAMCLGGLLVGLVQGKILYHQILIQNESQQQLLFERDVKEVPKYCRRRATWSTRLSCFALSGSALALTLLMIISECWDVPSANFVGIGLAGMILVHSGIPDMALEVDFQQAEDEDKLEDVRHEVEHDEKKDWTPVVMTERRNACSLDESHRWEVSSRCLETSCFRC